MLNDIVGFDILGDRIHLEPENSGEPNLATSAEGYMDHSQEIITNGPPLDRSAQLESRQQRLETFSANSGSAQPTGSIGPVQGASFGPR